MMFRLMINPRKLMSLILIGLSISGQIEGSHENLSADGCNISLDLTAVGLHSLPDGFVKNRFVTHLTLDENEIKSVSPEAFSLVPRLSYLSLAKNKLATLDLHPFSKLTDLDTLILNGNCKAKIITPAVSQNIARYSDYDYYYRSPPTAPPPYKEFCSLQFNAYLWNLTHLFLENNDIKVLSFISGKLPVLTHLHLSHNPLDLNPQTMSVLNALVPALTHIYLQYCAIQELKASQLPTVKYLYLDGNEIKSICNGYCIISSPCLNLSGGRRLETVSLSHNQISKVAADSFAHTPNLLILDLSHNKISEIQEGTFDQLFELQSLSLEHNELVRLSAADTFKDLISLETLFLGGNNISYISNGLFRNMSTLKHLMLNHTKLSSIDSESLSPLTSIEVLSLAGNQLSNIPEGSLPASGLITTLDLGHNEFTSTDNISLTNEPNIRSLSLSDNPLTMLRAQWIVDIGSENLTIILGHSSSG